MSESTKYDDALSAILVNEKSILGFLSTIFNFLARRTDFYYVPKGSYENMGFPPGVAEELVLKVVKTCDPKNLKPPNGTTKSQDSINDEIMCSTVAQEVEVIAEEDKNETDDEIEGPTELENSSLPPSSVESKEKVPKHPVIPDDYKPPVIPVQKNSESYNGAVRENYVWAQTITDLDVTAKLPSKIKTSKDLKVTINANDISVTYRDGDIILKDTFPHKIRPGDSFWSISERQLLIHLEKVQERWWNKLLSSEEELDLNKIDCSRPIQDLPEDHIDKVRELQWNQERKMQGLPTSDEIRNTEILKKAWNAEGSPFKGQPFDPSLVHMK